MTLSESASKLGLSKLFKDLPDSALEQLAAISEPRNVLAGAILLKEGEEGDTMFVIRNGRVRVEKKTPSDDTFTVTFLYAEAGDFFGELAMLDREVRSATVVCEVDCELLVVSRDRFVEFGDRNPEAGLKVTRRIARHIAERLRRSNSDIVTLFTALVQEIQERI